MPKLVASAKLTTSLRIIGIRDDGYHLLEAEMVSLTLTDVLTISPGEGVTYVGNYAPETKFGKDLISRALGLAGREAAVEVNKQIPPGAGLGGGSSDAAAVLRWAGFNDLTAASRLGADIPFCMVGGHARVKGVGELVEVLPFEDRTFTLLLLPFGCNTRAVYQTWDDLGKPEGDSGNDLEPAALVYEPRLLSWRDEFGNSTGETPRLAGSGSSWFVEGSFPGKGRLVVKTVKSIQ